MGRTVCLRNTELVQAVWNDLSERADEIRSLSPARRVWLRWQFAAGFSLVLIVCGWGGAATSASASGQVLAQKPQGETRSSEPSGMASTLAGSQAHGARRKLIPFEQAEKWGYKDSSGRVVIDPQFEIAEEFSAEGIAAVVDDKGWAYIDKTGNVLVRPFLYDNGPDPFAEGLARCIGSDGKIGFFDEKGQIAIPAQFQAAFPFQEGFAAVCIGCREERIGDARVTRDGKWGYVNHQGQIVIKPQFDSAFPFHEGMAVVCMECRQQPMGEHSFMAGGQWGYVNQRGDIAIPLQFESASEFEKGRAEVTLKGEPVVIDKTGRIVRRDRQ